ncbi:HAMP domain-containing histidine kinase [Massilia violaceinigra]|uniref:histidine kinase n=1 Tax=Massilia violaceinigra TaxID=2045208 RepID=A0ABY4A4I7_9BURK|nr:HAMP domain-containing sensor histidine kinase [Massilia violaceinigra]UOD29562.1 HAMP domain-containing histidine kinase [Massilia violaceinigra]
MTLATDQNSGARPLSGVSKALEALREPVLAHWAMLVRRNIRGAQALLTPILINTLPSFYANLLQALTPGYPRDDATSHSSAASAHGGERARMTDYGAEQLIHEYQLLQEAIREVSAAQGVAISGDEWLIIERSINAAIREAVRAFTSIHEELRHKVAAALSHDMRTPLAVIANGAQLIEVAQDLAQARRLGQKIGANAQRLETMVGEVLDALTAHNGARLPLRLARFDMRELIGQVRREFADRYPAALEVAAPSVTGWWCRETLRRALENLVANAIKYGDGGPIRIELTEAHGNIVLTVHNTGNPLGAEQRARIFDYLRRERQVQAPGWGIGLPFVRQAAESHGGSAAVDSSAAAGTTFLIDVPVDCRPYIDAGRRAAAHDAPALPAAGLAPALK